MPTLFEFLFKMMTYYPYVIVFGFLRKDVEDLGIPHAMKAFAFLERPLRWVSYLVIAAHAFIVFLLGSIGWAMVA